MLKNFEGFNSSRVTLMIGNWGLEGWRVRGLGVGGKMVENQSKLGDKLVPSFDPLFEQFLTDFEPGV